MINHTTLFLKTYSLNTCVNEIINPVENNSICINNEISQTSNESNKNNDVSTKTKAKRIAKSEIKTKFIIGHIYKLTDSKKNKYFVPRIFKCIKFIYSIKNIPVNIVIMQAIDNVKSSQKFSLNQTECYKFHIKYKPGLEVYSMSLNWKDITNLQK